MSARPARSGHSVLAAAALLGAMSLGACQASLDLDQYAFEEGDPSCVGEACAGSSSQLPPCGERPREGQPCREALRPEQLDRLRVWGGLSTVAPAPAVAGFARLRDARLETARTSCGSWRGARACVRGQISY